MGTPDIPGVKRLGLPVDLDRLAREGDEWLSPEDRYALKTHGVCAQVQPGVFMIRCRVLGGQLTPDQARGLCDLADAHGGGWLHVSTRQNVELHHIDARTVPAVLRAVEQLGLTNRSACGHTMRNVMACPDAGVGLDEPFDCGPDAIAVSDAVLARSEWLNCLMPSRINLAFGGCPVCAEHARLNDGGFQSVVVAAAAGYRLWGGGSLGTMPLLGVPLVDFVPRAHVVAAAEAIFDLFVARGDFENPKRARLKFLVESMGEEDFRAAYLDHYAAAVARTDYEPPSVVVPGADSIADVLRHAPTGGWSTSVRPQRSVGLAMVTINVPLGDLDSGEMRRLADLAGNGDGLLYTTRNQNVQFRDVPVGRVAMLQAAVEDLGLSMAGADSAVDVRACTGSAVCSLAITAAPSTGWRVAQSPALARNGALRVSVSGCPNSCAQHQAADIGLAGAKVKVRGEVTLGYAVFLGADVANGTLGEVAGRVGDDDVEAVVDAAVGVWEALRHPGERMADTVARLGLDAFAANVAAAADGFSPGEDDEPAADALLVTVAP